eukprot:CAMPEP_0172389846 /NCGR_PEP_ID=MMETSP1061-20121228/6635_1 /TAXON_ID=37318 /ORGANISM="Pseudo-nitzschia pungens, Strain cf. pungens" /LENGTH=119 /DNA_ID=CAMNT_0013120079 /DNA_START=183 /DNA_END=542 /DNA_ORIENTATION=+
MFSRSIYRFGTSQLVRVNPGIGQTRSLSSEGIAAVDKLKGVLEEYRARNYAQCIPTRFKKDIIRAAQEVETEHVALEGFEKVISNIGASNKVSRHDMELIFSENGVSGRITTEQMLKLL